MRALFVCSVLMVLPSSASSQEAPVTSACEVAAGIVATAPDEADTSRAFDRVQHCGSKGRDAIIRGMRTLSSTHDPVRIARFMSRLDGWRDASIADEAVRMAADANVASITRVYAIRHLVAILRPRYLITYESLVAPTDSVVTRELVTYNGGCRGSVVALANFSVTPLQAEHERRIRRTLLQLAENVTTGADVRNAARCALQVDPQRRS